MNAVNFEPAYRRILASLNIRTQTELAEALGIRQSSISDAKLRNSIPAEWLVTLVERHGLNPAWIKTGEGQKHLSPSDGVIIRSSEAVLDGADTAELLQAIQQRFPGQFLRLDIIPFANDAGA